MAPAAAKAADGVFVPTSGGLSPEWTNRRYQPRDIWAYQPLRQVAVPAVRLGSRPVDHAIDTFVWEKLVAEKLEPAPPADRDTLVRRVFYDLVGLPPTPTDLEEDGGRDDRSGLRMAGAS